MPRLALHWKIMIGLALGIAVGLVLSLGWGPGAWSAIGVDHPPAFLEGKPARATVPVLPQGVSSLAELDPALARRQPYHLTAAEIERLALETRPANAQAGFVASALRFVVRLNAFVGDVFMQSLKFIAVPIVLFSLIVGASSLNDLRKLSRIGGRTIAIYLTTTAAAITLGLVLANVIQPGSERFISAETRADLAVSGAAEATGKVAAAAGRKNAWDIIRDIIPVNPFKALAEGDMLAVVFFALAIGVGLTLIPRDKSQPVIRVADGLTDVIIKLVHIIMLTAPYAVFALVVKVVAQMGMDILASLLAYALVVISGLAVMVFGVYPLVLRTFTPVGYARFFRGIAPAQLLAFSSSSSSATLPVTMSCAEERLGVAEEVGSFVLPLGATINMDGTALYQGVATVFIAQMFGLPLTITDQLVIVLTATLASIGTAGVPGVGIVMLVIVMQALNFPDEVMTTGVAIILGVDRLLDMCRTTCNVTGDLMVATVVASREGALLDEAEARRRLEIQRQKPLDEHPRDPGPSRAG